MSYSHVPAAGDAAFEGFAGLTFDDPALYAAANAKRIDAKFFLKPVQDEVLNLIALALAGGGALAVRNETGAALGKGMLLCVSGYSGAHARCLVAKADAADPAKPAALALDADLAHDANGLAYPFRAVAGLDTSGTSAVGAAVFLGSTPGTFAHAAPAGASQTAQQVGVVTAKDALSGAVRFFPGARLTRALGSGALQDASVTAAKLADAVADQVPGLALAVGVESADQIDVTLQLKDAQGNNLAAAALLECWLADSATGWETATPADALTVQTGTAANVATAAVRLRVLTDAAGAAALRVAKTGAQTWHLRAALGGRVFTSGAVAF